MCFATDDQNHQRNQLRKLRITRRAERKSETETSRSSRTRNLCEKLLLSIMIATFSRPHCFGVTSFSISPIRPRLTSGHGSLTFRWVASNDVLDSRTIASCCSTIFDLTIPDGRCVAVELDKSAEANADDQLIRPALSKESHWIRKHLHPKEIAYGMGIQSDASRKSFLLGRLALRRSLEAFQQQQQGQHETNGAHGRRINNCVLLKDEYGRPSMPPGYLGSISHKGNVAVGLVNSSIECGADKSPIRAIGVDLELRSPTRSNIARRVLTENELEGLGRVGNLNRDEEILIRFSAKEALYKAMHPLICQYVSFREAEAWPRDDGTLDVSLNLKSGDHKRFGFVQAHWQLHGKYILTSAQIELDLERPDFC